MWLLSVEKLTIMHLPASQIDHFLKPRYTLQHKEPALAQIIALVSGKIEQTFDAEDVFRLQLSFTRN